MNSVKPTIPEVIDRFKSYHERERVWGSLHIVLEDGNVRKKDVEFCAGEALSQGDEEGYELALILLQMSKTQRLKLGQMA